MTVWGPVNEYLRDCEQPEGLQWGGRDLRWPTKEGGLLCEEYASPAAVERVSALPSLPCREHEQVVNQGTTWLNS